MLLDKRLQRLLLLAGSPYFPNTAYALNLTFFQQIVNFFLTSFVENIQIV